MKIFLRNEIIKNNALSNEAFAVYVLLRRIYSNDRTLYTLNAKYLYTLLTNDYKWNRNKLEHINNGIQELISSNIIAQKHKDGDSFVLDLTSIYLDTKVKGFTVIESHDLENIFKINTKYTKLKYNMMRYYVYLVYSFSSKISITLKGHEKKNFACSLKIDTMADRFSMSHTSIMEYNQILEQNKIIYIFRQNDFKRTEYGIQSFVNLYSLYKDKEYIIAYGEKERFLDKQYIHAKDNINQINKRKRLTQYYNSMLKGKVYSEEITKEVFDHIINENKKYSYIHKDKNTPPTLKSLDVFKQFDYLGFGNVESEGEL